MKNKGANVSAVLMSKKKEAEEEEEHTDMKNDMSFYLYDDPQYQVYATAVWKVNAAGNVIGDVDTYFYHILTGQRCESVWECLSGWSEPNEKSTEKWETLCSRIEKYENLEETICDEKRVAL